MKKDKTLLQEGTVRRFMKLAGTQPLASGFVNEMGYPPYKEDEVVAEDELELEDELEGGDELEMDVDMGAPEEMPEPELEPEGGEGEVTLTDEEVEALLTALDAANEVADKLRGAAELAEPEELEAPEMELEPEVPGMTGEPMEGEDEELEEAVADVDVVDDEKVMKEVYKRVAKRLSKLKGK
jgi:hypothetical protein